MLKVDPDWIFLLSIDIRLYPPSEWVQKNGKLCGFPGHNMQQKKSKMKGSFHFSDKAEVRVIIKA